MSQLILKPIISEKSMMLAAAHVYSFEVPMTTNKIEVARAVKAAFNVDATAVRIIITKGKIKRFKGKAGKRVDVKKALVSVKKGQSISIFDAEPEVKDDKKAKKADKPAKTSDKKAKEEAK
jgi:large subunit ribosomal protein L23